jgi:hypothetical protein
MMTRTPDSRTITTPGVSPDAVVLPHRTPPAAARRAFIAAYDRWVLAVDVVNAAERARRAAEAEMDFALIGAVQ